MFANKLLKEVNHLKRALASVIRYHDTEKTEAALAAGDRTDRVG